MLARTVTFKVDRHFSEVASRCLKFELYGCRKAGKQSTESFMSSCSKGTSPWNNQLKEYVNNKNADITANPYSLISVFLIRHQNDIMAFASL